MSTYRVLVSDPVSEKGVQALKEAPGIEVDVNTGLAPDKLLEIIGRYHGLVVRSQTKVTHEVFAAAKNLKVSPELLNTLIRQKPDTVGATLREWLIKKTDS